MNRLNQQGQEEPEEDRVPQDELDDMLDDLITREDKDDQSKPEKGRDIDDLDSEEEETVEVDEVEPEGEEPEGDEEEEEEEPDEEPDDDLMELSRRGLLKLIESDKLDIQIADNATEVDIRQAIRDARAEIENDPERRIDEMREWMNEQAKTLLSGQQPDGQTLEGVEGKPEGQQPQAPQVPPPVDAEKFRITDEMYEDAMRDKDGFTKYTNDLLQVGEQRAMQRVMPMVNQLVQQQFALHTIVNDFYSDNPDLRPYREFVSFLASQVGSKHPDKSYPEVLGMVEQEARRRLRLAKAEAGDDDSESKPKKTTKPAFAGDKVKGNRRRKDKVKLSKEEREMSDLIDDDLDDPFAGRI